MWVVYGGSSGSGEEGFLIEYIEPHTTPCDSRVEMAKVARYLNQAIMVFVVDFNVTERHYPQSVRARTSVTVRWVCCVRRSTCFITLLTMG